MSGQGLPEIKSDQKPCKTKVVMFPLAEQFSD